MRRVILTVGPQCAGKSTYCQKVISSHPETVLISRDAILTELFGTVWLDKYEGGHLIAVEKMWGKVADCLIQDDVTLILDTWNSGARDRREITDRLRSLGAEIIEAWDFVTPRRNCLKWYFQREKPNFGLKDNKWRRISLHGHIQSYYFHYEYYHKQPICLEQGFDSIRQINPLSERCLKL